MDECTDEPCMTFASLVRTFASLVRIFAILCVDFSFLQEFFNGTLMWPLVIENSSDFVDSVL